MNATSPNRSRFPSQNHLPSRTRFPSRCRVPVPPVPGPEPLPHRSGVRTPIPAPIPVPVDEAFWYLRAELRRRLRVKSFRLRARPRLCGSDCRRGAIGQLRALVHRRRRHRLRVERVFPHGYHRRRPLDNEHRVQRQRRYEIGDRQDKVHVDHPARQCLLRHSHRHPWSPFLGLGVGFAVNQVTRNLNYDDTAGPVAVDAGNRTTDVQFAGAAMVGVTYDISTFWALDLNYRFLHIGGSEVSLKPDVASSVAIGDLNEHQIRAGLRFLVN